MRAVIDTAIRGDHLPVMYGGDTMFFLSPSRAGHEVISLVIAERPTMVIGVDLLFWYAYGHRSGKNLHQKRMESLEEGLSELDRLDAYIVIGDIPDMHPAIGFMLSEDQVPSVETISAMNDRILAWASSRPRVAVMPLHALVERLYADQRIAIGQNTWPAGSRGRLLQGDMLHPTLDGMIAIAIEAALTAAESFPNIDEADFDLDAQSILATLSSQ
jgi:hypothetical protein